MYIIIINNWKIKSYQNKALEELKVASGKWDLAMEGTGFPNQLLVPFWTMHINVILIDRKVNLEKPINHFLAVQ